MKNYIKELLLEDNEMSDETINYYINKIIEELKFCRITQKSVEEISLHEFEKCEKNYKGVYENFFVLYVRVIYNGDFEHQFDVYRKGK
jgi:hypothetical protein